MAKLGSKLRAHRAVISAALLTQFAAVLVGIIVLYSCAREGPHLPHPLREAVYWGIVGPAGMTIIAAPLNLALLGALGVMFFLGLRRPKVRFLWYAGILLWGAWWVLMTYIMCAIADD